MCTEELEQWYTGRQYESLQRSLTASRQHSGHGETIKQKLQAVTHHTQEEEEAYS